MRHVTISSSPCTAARRTRYTTSRSVEQRSSRTAYWIREPFPLFSQLNYEERHQMNKRQIAIGVIAALSTATVMTGVAHSNSQLSEDEAHAAIMTWYAALRSNDPKRVDEVMAPEFQILRSDGSGYDRIGYLGTLPKVKSDPVVSNLTFTSTGDLLVARYTVTASETINGKATQTTAPRLSVMRKQDGKWLMIAHSNFAKIS